MGEPTYPTRMARHARLRRIRVRRGYTVLFAGLALVLIVAAVSAAAPSIRPNALSAYSIWGATIPANPQAGAAGPREVGTVFTTSDSGYVSSLRFYKGVSNTGTHVGNLSTDKGVLLASATYTKESASGWQVVQLKRPVQLSAGSSYIVSYTTGGGFAQDGGAFAAKTISNGGLTATGGVSRAVGGTWATPDMNSYYSDVIYSSSRRPGSVITPAPTTSTISTSSRTSSTTSSTTTSSTTTATTTTTTTTTTSPTTTSTTTTPAGLRLVPVDGGTGFYGRFTSPLPTSTSYFPLGVWFESVISQADVDMDKAAGLNTYVELTDNSNVSLLSGSGMNILTSNLSGLGATENGHLLGDEVDMQYGPGAGYDVMTKLNAALPDDGKVRYANYGKGVVFWETDAEAAQFVNEFQDFTSTDVYWYTDSDACQASQGGYLLGVSRNLTSAECHRASNYGVQVDKVRRLAGYDTPIWTFVELGNPWSGGGRQINPDQAAAAVWSSLIHGARGIVYFNHSFGGSCQSQHILRDPCYSAIRARITSLNAQITRLAAVLNAPRVDGLNSVTGAVDTLTKYANGSLYVFAGAQAAASTTARFSMPCVGNATVTVLDENRTIPMSSGVFTDSFANDTSYHLYRIDGGSRCGLS